MEELYQIVDDIIKYGIVEEKLDRLQSIKIPNANIFKKINELVNLIGNTKDVSYVL